MGTTVLMPSWQSHSVFLLPLILLLDPTQALPAAKSISQDGKIITETSNYQPDNETQVEVRLTVKNRDPKIDHIIPGIPSISSILLSDAVMNQVVGAVTQALAVNDMKEAEIVGNSIRTAVENLLSAGKNSSLENKKKLKIRMKLRAVIPVNPR